MKNYSQFITELNKFETMLKLGKSVGRFTGLGKTPLKKDMIMKMRNHPNNMELGKVIRNMFWDVRDISHDRQLDLFD